MKYEPYIKKYHITTNDKDMYGNISPTAILNILQDISGLDANRLGYGYLEAMKKDAIWVLARSEYEIDNSKINLNEPFVVITYPNKGNGFFIDRNYRIENSKGETILKAKFKWGFISFSARKMVSIDKVITNDEYEYPKKQEINTPLKALDIDEAKYKNTYHFKVNYSMCDENKHMNNTKYVQELLNAYELKEDEEIISLQINYLKELPLHSEVDIKFYKEEDELKAAFYFSNHIVTKIILKIKNK